jgi:hypothetical protein
LGYPQQTVGLSDRISRFTSIRIYPVGKSDVPVGKSDANPAYPVGGSDIELLARYYYLQIVLSLFPTVFFT